MIEIEVLPAVAADDIGLVGTICELVNRAYEVAEQGFWRDRYLRTTFAETAEAIAREELAVARLDGRVAGSVCTRRLDSRTGWFGALAVAAACSGRGLGGALVRFVEEHAASAGASTMQLELLVPRPEHPHASLLAAWYVRLGYREVERREIAELFPAALPFLAAECDVAVMRKPLTSPAK